MENTLNELLSKITEFYKVNIASSKEVLEASNYKMYMLDFLSVAVNNRAISLSNAYACLVSHDNYLAAIPLIRLQLDNVLRYFAATLVKSSDEFILHILDGKNIRDYTDHQGNKLTDSFLAREFDKHFPNTNKLYKEICGYIHLSDKYFYTTVTNVTRKDRKVSIKIDGKDNYSLEEKVKFAQAMLGVSNLVVFMNKMWINEKERMGAIHDNKKKS